ncbi:MAG: hypothetical protein SVU32_03135 [Candidatus Nanohaloarchaea archaeon]|nr:hypothetical protein [Candidatus Nanohaloarchaea archaeon]
MEDGYGGRCMHGCYPTEDVDTVRKIARSEGPAAAEKYLRENQPQGEPYVGADEKADPKHQRAIKVSAGSQGIPVDTYLSTLNRVENTHDYTVKKVSESLQAQPGSSIHQEFQQRRQQAEQRINQTLGSLADLYEQKHLLEHDIRKLEQKKSHFDDKDEDALKADFVDQVDQHTGRSSIIQMQANNVFPSITADFYAMKSLSDLTEGHLSDLPEQEKAVLRKKWKLYQKWKEQYGEAIGDKLDDLQKRLTSIEETENWVRPYVQTLKQLQGDPAERVQEMTDPYMLEGYSSSMRHIKVICHKPVRFGENEEGEEIPTHRDVIVIDVAHISLGGTEQPQAPGQGAEVVQMDFMETTVCEHVFQEVFQPQIDEREEMVKRFVREFKGEDVPLELKQHTAKPFEPYDKSFPEELKHNVMRWFGLGDEYFHPDPSDLRGGLLGPAFGGPSPLYIEVKYDIGMYVMK